MLQKVNNPNITAETGDFRISPDVVLHTKVLRAPGRSGRKAIYIHGGGGGGNHTLIERPSRWLIDQGLFDEMILPDRRGDGGSSPLTRKLTMMEHGEDMLRLLDELGVQGPLTAMGVSYGGPIALALAYLDPRVDRAVLIASSPTLSQTSPYTTFLIKSGLLRKFLLFMFRRNVGKLPPGYVDFDPAYEASSPKDMSTIFFESLKRQPASRLESLVLEIESTLDRENSSIPEEVQLEIPVLQAIGEKDEIWGSDMPEQYLQRFPNFRRKVVAGARRHKDVFLKSLPFYEAAAQLLREEQEQVLAV